MHGLHGDVLIRTDEVRDPLLFTRVEVSGRNHNCQFDGFSYKWASETYPPKLSSPRVVSQAFFFFTNMHALCSPKRYSSNQYRIVRVPIFPHTKNLNSATGGKSDRKFRNARERERERERQTDREELSKQLLSCVAPSRSSEVEPTQVKS